MFLSRIHLDPRSREARRDLADPYQMHATLCRAFSAPEAKCPPGTFLWRLEPETDAQDCPKVMIQSRTMPAWGELAKLHWLAGSPDPAIDLARRLDLEHVAIGHRFRFRLRANPSVTRNGKRVGLLDLEAQVAWLARQGSEHHGFSLQQRQGFDLTEASVPIPEVEVTQALTVHGHQHNGNGIQVFSALFNGLLEVTAPPRFRLALEQGIGHGKSMGLGLLSLAPMA